MTLGSLYTQMSVIKLFLESMLLLLALCFIIISQYRNRIIANIDAWFLFTLQFLFFSLFYGLVLLIRYCWLPLHKL